MYVDVGQIVQLAHSINIDGKIELHLLEKNADSAQPVPSDEKLRLLLRPSPTSFQPWLQITWKLFIPSSRRQISRCHSITSCTHISTSSITYNFINEKKNRLDSSRYLSFFHAVLFTNHLQYVAVSRLNTQEYNKMSYSKII